MKHIVLSCVACVVWGMILIAPFSPLRSQSTRCDFPELLHLSVVHYEGYAKALVAFRTAKLMTRVRVWVDSDVEWGEWYIPRGSGQLYLTQLPLNKFFTVEVEDLCGEMEVLARFETFPGLDHVAGIGVSKPLFELLDLFARQDDTDLVAFLAAHDELSVMERLAFLQQYLLDGQPFAQDYGREWPPAEVFAQSSDEPCRCRFVFMRWQSVEDGSMGSGVITPATAAQSGSLGDPGAIYELQGAWAGPAKDLTLYTRGCRVGKEKYEKSYKSGDLYGEMRRRLEVGYLYLCIDEEKRPDTCACEKCLYLSSEYISSLFTKITKDAGWCISLGNKAAWADAEDFAVLMKEDSAGLEVLAAGQAHVSAYAEVTANLDFWLSPLEMASAIASSIAGGDSTSGGIGGAIEALAEAIEQMLSVKAWEHEGTWGIKEKRTTLVFLNDYKYCFQPNQSVRFHLFSASYLRAGGKRKWRAWARARSAFLMDAVVHADAGPPQACCTNQFGNWIAKGLDEQYDTEYMLGKVRADFALWPWDGWDPYQPLPGEYGELSYSIGCEPGLQGPPIEWLQGKGMQAAEAELHAATSAQDVSVESMASDRAQRATPESAAAAALRWPCRLYVYDLTGRLVWSGVEPWPRTSQAVMEALREEGWLVPGKIYVFHWRSYGASKTEKVFVR